MSIQLKRTELTYDNINTATEVLNGSIYKKGEVIVAYYNEDGIVKSMITIGYDDGVGKYNIVNQNDIIDISYPIYPGIDHNVDYAAFLESILDIKFPSPCILMAKKSMMKESPFGNVDESNQLQLIVEIFEKDFDHVNCKLHLSSHTIEPYNAYMNINYSYIKINTVTEWIVPVTKDSVNKVDISQRSIIVEKDFATHDELVLWTSEPLNMAKVREGTIFRVLDNRSPDYKVTYNQTSKVFEATAIKPSNASKIETVMSFSDGEVVTISQQKLNVALAKDVLYLTVDKQDTLTAGSNIDITNNIISAEMDIPSTNVTAALYINSTTTLSDNEPLTDVSIPIILRQNQKETVTLIYTVTQDIIISPTSLYYMYMIMSSLDSKETYTVKSSYLIGSLLVSQGTSYLKPTTSTELVQIPMNVNLLTSNVKVVTNDELTVKIEISKSNNDNDIVYIRSTPSNPSAFIRNGGEIITNNVYGLWNGEVKTQSTINSIIENELLGVIQLQKDILNRIG